MRRHTSVLAHIVAVCVVLVWGITFINTKLLLSSGLTPEEIFVMRFAIAYVCIWTISPRQLWCHTWRDELRMLLLGITGGSLYFAAENEALRRTMANNVSFIVCTAPLFTVLMALVLLPGVRATHRLLAGSLTAIAGMAAIIFNGHFVLHLSPRGDMLALTAALSWAAYSLLIRSVSARYSAVFISRKVFAYGLITIVPLFAWRPWQTGIGSVLASPTIVFNILFLSLVASFTCFVLWSWVVKELGALSSSNYIYLNPVATCFASAAVLGEPITPIAVCGLAMVLLGVYLANSSHSR